MSEIRACPFCGSSNVAHDDMADENYCKNCEAHCFLDSHNWQTRPIEDELVTRCSRLKEEKLELIENSERLAKYIENEYTGVDHEPCMLEQHRELMARVKGE